MEKHYFKSSHWTLLWEQWNNYQWFLWKYGDQVFIFKSILKRACIVYRYPTCPKHIFFLMFHLISFIIFSVPVVIKVSHYSLPTIYITSHRRSILAQNVSLVQSFLFIFRENFLSTS